MIFNNRVGNAMTAASVMAGYAFAVLGAIYDNRMLLQCAPVLIASKPLLSLSRVFLEGDISSVMRMCTKFGLGLFSVVLIVSTLISTTVMQEDYNLIYASVAALANIVASSAVIFILDRAVLMVRNNLPLNDEVFYVPDLLQRL